MQECITNTLYTCTLHNINRCIRITLLIYLSNQPHLSSTLEELTSKFGKKWRNKEKMAAPSPITNDRHPNPKSCKTQVRGMNGAGTARI